MLIDDLDYARQVAVMLGAVCHDLGKPPTTEFVEGRWRSRGHDEAGVGPTLSLLDRLGRSGTRMQMFYSVKNGSGLDALRRRIPEPYPPAGTSIRHTLLSPAIIDELHDGGIEVYAWTVNNPHRAEELVGWGVDGIIADNLDVLRVARA